jgi:hypothetical protein
MTVERLVQEHGIERRDIFILPDSKQNSAGEKQAGSDAEARQPSPEHRDDAPLHGTITVSVDIEDDVLVNQVRADFAEFDASEIVED